MGEKTQMETEPTQRKKTWKENPKFKILFSVSALHLQEIMQVLLSIFIRDVFLGMIRNSIFTCSDASSK